MTGAWVAARAIPSMVRCSRALASSFKHHANRALPAPPLGLAARQRGDSFRAPVLRNVFDALAQDRQ